MSAGARPPDKGHPDSRGAGPAARAASSRRRERRPGAVVLQVDCSGVYVEPVTLRRRLQSHLLADRLDRSLAAGGNPESDVLLALRAQQLACTHTRRELATALQRLVRVAVEPQHGLARSPSMAVLSRVVGARADFESLTDHLLAPVPVSARGVALVRLLLREGTGPLFRYESTADLGLQVRRAAAALDPGSDWPA